MLFLQFYSRDVPARGILFGDRRDGRFRFDIRVCIADDYRNLVLCGQEVRVDVFEGADIVQFEVPVGLLTVQVSVERRFKLLAPVSSDLHIESTP